ncbi:CoA transferase [Mycolicibacterium sp. 120270]|nr:CoA transferase [Mycolicibacterium sp. 120270]MDX1883700.1 CoA transferase [Mycolicibacterium sp. 120270]
MTCVLLSELRVLDLCDGDADAVTRLFADLGADVLKVEAPGGNVARTQQPLVSGASVPFALNNANKRVCVLDPADGGDRDRFAGLAASADIVVDSGPSGRAAEFGTSCAELSRRHPHLVAVSVTDFGVDGPRAAWSATDPVLYALSTSLSRSGPTTVRPVLPPNGIASATAAGQAAWAALVAYYHRLRYGTGEYIDFSRFEAVVQSLDPPFGVEGQAAVGLKQSHELWRGRPRNQQVYPIFPCRDGHVRICLLSPRQWRGMRSWLGEPEQFQDPKFDTIAARYAASRELNELIEQLCASQTMDELVAAGQSRGVPIAAVLTPSETINSKHFTSVGALTEATLAPGVDVTVPVGPFVVDSQHRGFRQTARSPGGDEARWRTERTVTPEVPEPSTAHRPFEGLRILDLGVIVAGGELGRLFADLGAEVIKIESAAYPDGLRQTPPGQVMSRSWALAHRNEYGLGLDLRHPEGADIFARLVAGADAVFANFKPGTLAALGFPNERLRELNPNIVLAESSAYGASGPWSTQMGYGPLVRATAGVTRLWTSDDEPGFFDATTIFPDHAAARVIAIAALASLIGREHTETGAHVHISQAETAVNQLAASYVVDTAAAAGMPVDVGTAVHGVYPCAGDDEWCVISLRNADDRTVLAAAMSVDALPDDRAALVDAVSAWTSDMDNNVVAETLQRAGVPAAPMNRAVDVLADPAVVHRKLFTDMVHPLFDQPIPTETSPSVFAHIPRAELRPAPLAGEHTREICQKLLAMDTEEIDRLIADGVLFTAADPSDPSRTPQ